MDLTLGFIYQVSSLAPPDFGNQGGKLCPPKNTGTPGFSDLPTALYKKVFLVTANKKATESQRG